MPRSDGISWGCSWEPFGSATPQCPVGLRMAESKGFEPLEHLRAQRFSRRLHSPPVPPKTPRNRMLLTVSRAFVASLRVPIMANLMANTPVMATGDGGQCPAVRLAWGASQGGRSQRNQPDLGQRGRVAAQFMLGGRRGPSTRQPAKSRRRRGLRRRASLRRHHWGRAARRSMTRR
jgi:hypothetical protein